MPQDHDAFLQQYLACQERLRAYVMGVVRDRHLVDDVMQEIGIVCWRKWDQYDPERPFAAWARGIARNCLYQQAERLGRNKEILSPEALEALSTAYDALDERADDIRLHALASCLQHLDNRARTLLQHRYQDDLDLATVAERVGRGKEAVGKALQRLRTALGRCIEKQLGHEGHHHA